MNKYLKYGIMGAIAASASAILFKPQPAPEVTSSVRTYEDILQSGTIRAVTEYNSVSYHAEGDSVGGLHYELLQAFAQAKGLQVEITPEMSMDARAQGIEEGTYDILANNVLVSSDRKDSILCTLPILMSRQILIQRKPQSENDSTHIQSLLELAQKTIHVAKGSPSVLRIKNLSNEIGDTIYVEEVDKYGQEQLLAMVANGDIDYAVCDEGIALASVNLMPQLDIETAISFTQFYSWGVNPNNIILLDTLNAWIDEYCETPEFQKLMNKYTTNKAIR